MGQGIYTSIAMILAEELDADFAKVALDARAAERQALRQSRSSACRSPAIPTRSGRSGSRCARPAPARAPCWSQAAAQQWQVEPASCTTANGEVDRTTPAAASSPMARSPTRASKPDAAQGCPAQGPEGFRLIGKPLKRLDTPDKVNGKAVYGIDAMLAGHEIRDAGACPVFGGKVGKVDDSAAKKIPGRAEDRRARRSGRGGRRSHVGGEEGPRGARDRLGRRPERQAQFERRSGDDLRAASEKDGAVAKSVGDIAKGLATGDKLEASYELPFLAHATMEPMNCHGSRQAATPAKSGPAPRS